MGYRLARVKPVHSANHFVYAAKAHIRHNLAQLFGYEKEVVDDMLRLAREKLAEVGILRCDAHRAGVEVAFA